jgi:hypothetical protein
MVEMGLQTLVAVEVEQVLVQQVEMVDQVLSSLLTQLHSMPLLQLVQV